MAKRRKKAPVGLTAFTWAESTVILNLRKRIELLEVQAFGPLPRLRDLGKIELGRMSGGFDERVTTKREPWPTGTAAANPCDKGEPETRATDEKPIDWPSAFAESRFCIHPGALDRIRREHERGLLGISLGTAIAHLIEEALIARGKRL